MMCERDNNGQVASKRDQWRDGTESLTERGVATDYDEHPPSPMFEGRFARLRGVDAAMSRAAVEELRAQGMLDEGGFLTTSPEEIVAALQAAPRMWPAFREVIMASSVNDVVRQLQHTWSGHMMYDDWSARTLDFLEAQTP